jgi:hypothetical protein
VVKAGTRTHTRALTTHHTHMHTCAPPQLCTRTAGHTEAVVTVFAPDDETIVSGGCDHAIIIWQVAHRVHGFVELKSLVVVVVCVCVCGGHFRI